VDADSVLLERLQFLRNETRYLKSEREHASSFHEYSDNTRLRKAVERSLHLAVETCIDIGRRLIVANNFRNPENNSDVFQVLAEDGIISNQALPSFLDMARFRNPIVHDYARIDDALVYRILTTRLGDFDAYAHSIRAHVQGS
jgi:uncharacterized protein YutE (UPF0331/DUF86 family)